MEVSGKNFGLLIAFVLPGFVSLWGVSHFSPTLAAWLLASSVASGDSASVGGFLYVTLASVVAGLTASTIRWAIVDRLHEVTGIRRPAWDDSRLQECLGAFEALIDNHYRYYQFYANMLVVMLFLFAARLVVAGGPITELDPLDCGILAVACIYWAGSRDTLRKYYSRAEVLLGTREREVDDDERSLHEDGKHEEEGGPSGQQNGPESQGG